VPVPFADLLTPHFLTEPERLFAEDHFHPSAAGYALAAKQLLPALCQALGETPPESQPWPQAVQPATRLARLTRLLGRQTTGVPAAVVLPAD
jgi:hypothetical protein